MNASPESPPQSRPALLTTPARFTTTTLLVRGQIGSRIVRDPGVLVLLLLMLTSSLPAATNRPASFGYVLQAEALGTSRAVVVKKLTASGRDWLILDADFTAPSQAWRAAELDTIREGQPNRRLLGYLSLGEAESYRAYWRAEWDANRDGRPDAGAPEFLVVQNPDWHGNYRVKYWREDWQRLALTELDRIVAAGFDGAYLDIVDGFEFFEREGKRRVDDRLNSETSQSFRRDMVDWVRKLAAHARRQRPGFGIVPQNGMQLLAHADFREVVDAVGVEDLFTDDDRAQPDAHTRFIQGFLRHLAGTGKPVLVTEYARKQTLRTSTARRAREAGFTLLFANRALNTLGELP